MKTLILSFIVMVLAQGSAHGSGAKRWNCDDSDYHMSIVTEPASKNLSFLVCEFGSCGNQPLRYAAELVSSNAGLGQFTYRVTTQGPNYPQKLVLTFKDEDTLESVVEDGSHFNSCVSY